MQTATIPATRRRPRTGPPPGRLGILVLVACTVLACTDNKTLTPIGPSDTAFSDPTLTQEVRQQWSPYVGLHVTGEALSAYQDSLTRLLGAGRLRGVRLEISRNHLASGDPVTHAIGALGVELLGLINNEFLFDPDLEGVIDRIFAAYPEIRYFQVGNEITTILPATGPTMTIEGYMAAFQRIYDHVQLRYPNRATLLTQSTLGSGLHGPQELEQMAALGLAQMDPGKVILAINDYDPYEAGNYVGLLGGTLRRFRVWVTESGVPNPDQHISFVREGYPLLRNYLRAERIYWYVLWGGDSGSDAEFSLIRNPANTPNYWTSPLFTMLTQR
jgi:hypothetical protein